MANIKSQIKRNRQNEKRRLRNRNARGLSRTAVIEARAALEQKSPETGEAVMKAISSLDKAAGQGVIHMNAAARRKSRLMKKLASMGGTLAKKVEEPKAIASEAKAEPKKKAPAKKAAEKKTREKKPAAKKTAAK